MSRCAPVVWLALLAVPALVPGPAIAAVGADRLTVRLARGAAPEALRYLAQIGEPEPRTLAPGESLEAAIERHYGVIDATLLALTLAENPALVDANGRRVLRTAPIDITMPAGPRWAAGVAVVVPPGARVGELAQLYIGFEGPRTLADIAKASGLSAQALGSVHAGTRLQIPYQALPVSIEVRPEFRARADEVAAELQALDPERVLLAVPEPEIAPIALLDAAAFAAAGTTCSAGDAAAWPFDGAALVQIMAENPAAESAGARTLPVISVADSGVDPADVRFAFWSNHREREGEPGVNDDDNEYYDDVAGADVASHDGDPAPDATAKQRDHGTFVAGLAFGGTRGGALWAPSHERIRLLPVKLSGGPGVPVDAITGAAVLDAVRYANERAPIVNLSLEKYAEWGSLREWIALSPGTLFVVAAGNRGADVYTSAVYPAALGGESARNVVTVGAHDGSGAIATFSNRSAAAVDVLAPGCDLESTRAGGGSMRASGTSAAAPLVSYAAALLYDAGLRRPAEIKQRLVVAADSDPKLRGVVWSEGRLDIAAALDLRHDRIRTTDGRVLRGIVTNPAIRLGDTNVPLRRILKLVPLAPGAAGQRARIALRVDQAIEFDEYLVNATSLTIRTASGTETLPLAEIRDFVRRTLQPRD